MATFTIGAVVATFDDVLRGTSQEAGDLERLTLGMLITAPEWADLLSLVTTKYHVHVPLSGNIILDIVRGPGTGALVVPGLGSTTALLVGLRRGTYLPSVRSLPTADFLITAAWT